MNILKTKISLFLLIAIASAAIYSCSKEESGVKCTTYLNGSVYSEQTVSDCSLCSAPQGFTTTCN